MLTLAVTTSTSTVGVAVGDRESLAFNEIVTDRRHAEELTPLIATTLAAADAKTSDLGLLVVDVGPGRFTGLRVGLATVRALALATGCGVVGLTSLEILAAAEPDRPVLAVVDARRGEVFQQRFDADGPTSPPAVGRPDDLAPSAGATGPGSGAGTGSGTASGLAVVGDGADRYPEHYGPGLRPGRAPSASVMVSLARDRPVLPGPDVEPLYLREPDVHINVKTRHTPR